MRVLGETALYKEAVEALSKIQTITGKDESLKTVARFFLYACKAEVPEPLFPYVGDEMDERDRAHIRAYNEAWQAFINGDDEDDC